MLKRVSWIFFIAWLSVACSARAGQIEQGAATRESATAQITLIASDVIQPTSQPATLQPSSTLRPSATKEPPTYTATVTPHPTNTPTAEGYFYGLFPCLPRETSVLKGIAGKVIDGDTIEISVSDGMTNTVRYIGIDAPESGRPFSEQASEANSELVLGKEITLIQDVSQTDQYGRMLRYVISGNTFVNLELVRMGLAEAESWPPDVACDDTFSAAEEGAHQAGLGRWAATPTAEASALKLVIITVNKREEWVDIQNQSEEGVDLTGWNLVSERGHQECRLSGILAAGTTLRVWAMTAQGQGFSCGYNSPIWNNSEPDPAVLYDPAGVEVSRK